MALFRQPRPVTPPWILIGLMLTATIATLFGLLWFSRGTAATDGTAVSGSSTGRAVVLAIQRDRQLHILDAQTLEPLGRIRVHNLADGVQARTDGRMLFIRQADTPAGNGCCALFALDLTTLEMCRLIVPAVQSVPLTSNGRVFNQRGNAGIEVFDAASLERLPTIAAPGIYNLLPSPDGRWLFGINRFLGTTLDVFDALAGTFIRQIPVRLPDGEGGHDPQGAVTGAWLGERFFLFASEEGNGHLWTLGPETEELGSPAPVSFAAPELADPRARAGLGMIVPSGDRLLLYDGRAWWGKEERVPGAPGAGLFVLDPESATVTTRLTDDVEFAQVVTDGDWSLFGLDAGDPRQSRPVRLLALDAQTGTVRAERTVPTDVWRIAAATIPENLLPRGEVEPTACTRPEAPPAPPPTTPGIAPR